MATALRAFTHAALAMVLLLVSVSCATDDTYLPALLDDPMADYENPDLGLLRRVESPAGVGLFTGGDEAAGLNMRYLIEGDIDEVFRHLLEYGEESGWTTTGVPAVPSGDAITLEMRKELPPGTAFLSAFVVSEDSAFVVSEDSVDGSQLALVMGFVDQP